jgi:SAM-dependent methyltransferase
LPNLHESAVAAIRDILAKVGPGTEDQAMAAVLRLAAKWRSQMLANTMLGLHGTTILHGPFAGMRYMDRAAEGSLVARLIGSYESELHPHLAAFASQGIHHVVDIGCAEGYYAVGLARLWPQANVYAFDTDPEALKLCAALARSNGVAERVHLGGEFHGDDFEKFVGRRALFIVDIEGGERYLLDPELYPALKQLQFIVETHPGASPGVIEALIGRFSPTHDIQLVLQGPKTTPLPEWLQSLGHLDSLLAVWEWRSTPTPWLVMRPKAAAKTDDSPSAGL